MNRDSQVSSTSGNMNGEDPSSTSGTEGDSLLILKDLNEENPSSSTPVVPDEETPSSSTSAMPDACESPVSSSFDLRSQFHSNSPAYVKWDFDLPPASDAVKQKAKQLGREIRELHHSAKKNRKSVRSTPYLTSNVRKLEDSPSAHVSYCKSLKLLKEAIGESTNKKEDPLPESVADKKPTNDSVSEQRSTLFDDSLNDFMVEFSKNIEDDFLSTQASNETANESQQPEAAYTTPEQRLEGRKDFKIVPRNLSLEMDDDDDLFRDVDV